MRESVKLLRERKQIVYPYANANDRERERYRELLGKDRERQ